MKLKMLKCKFHHLQHYQELLDFHLEDLMKVKMVNQVDFMLIAIQVQQDFIIVIIVKVNQLITVKMHLVQEHFQQII